MKSLSVVVLVAILVAQLSLALIQAEECTVEPTHYDHQPPEVSFIAIRQTENLLRPTYEAAVHRVVKKDDTDRTGATIKTAMSTVVSSRPLFSTTSTSISTVATATATLTQTETSNMLSITTVITTSDATTTIVTITANGTSPAKNSAVSLHTKGRLMGVTALAALVCIATFVFTFVS
jgi:hypothetical protein